MSVAVKEFRNLAVPERRAVGEIAHYALRTPYPDMARGFAQMMADEARHVQTLVEAVELLGGEMEPVSGEEAVALDLQAEITDGELARFLGQIAHVEADLPELMASTLATVEDDQLQVELAKRISGIAADESRHREWAAAEIKSLLAGPTSDEVQKALESVDRSPTQTL